MEYVPRNLAWEIQSWARPYLKTANAIQQNRIVNTDTLHNFAEN